MKYLTDILITLIVAALLAVGTGLNMEGFTATAHGMLWFYAVTLILASLLSDMNSKSKKEYTHYPLLWMAYVWTSDLAFIAAAAWLVLRVNGALVLFAMEPYLRAGRQFTGIEKEQKYFDIAADRIARAEGREVAA
ncbi:hypothetical protein ACQUWL_13345 [Serratia marcescens]|uniref:hypothetical protein n=1 Tax=Serratia marcescens TaxID=615 RepID=UPI003D181FE2